jgi:hypothetical protein
VQEFGCTQFVSEQMNAAKRDIFNVIRTLDPRK